MLYLEYDKYDDKYIPITEAMHNDSEKVYLIDFDDFKKAYLSIKQTDEEKVLFLESFIKAGTDSQIESKLEERLSGNGNGGDNKN